MPDTNLNNAAVVKAACYVPRRALLRILRTVKGIVATHAIRGALVLSVLLGVGCSATRSIALPASIGLSNGSGYKDLGRIGLSYYRPRSHSANDPIIVVMHGGGRNSADYRDAWIDLADQYHVLVLAPEFSDEAFPNARGYNLGGMKSLLGFARAPEQWAFSEIDPMVRAVMDGIGSARNVYDLFGHSAGGQFVHRLVLFCPDAAVDRAVAANSGWYTLPTFNERFPYGLTSAPGPEVQLKQSMGTELIVMLGELDNSASAGGHLRTTREAMRQGPGRRQRGEYFMATAKRTASERGVDLRWRTVVVPEVGHSYRSMAIEAATILYGHPQGSE